jgi:signal transduction histidine kinase
MTGAEPALRVLVVDDEEALGIGVRRVLEPFRVPTGDSHGEAALEVRTAKSGEEGLAVLKDFRADLVLLDYKLPGMDGIEVLRQLSRDGGGPMVIMITAYASLETAVKATKMGSYDFLAKPFTPEELRYAVRKAAEHILLRRRAERLASERRRIRFEFLSVLAHELKAPLDAVEGYLDILLEKIPGPPAQMLGRCQERVTGMKKLILDLLDLTRIESGEKNRDIRRIDLVGVLRRGVETQLPRARKRDIRIEVDAPPAFKFLADEGEMDIIFNNLLSNAVKYNSPGGRVRVALRQGPDGAELRVADTGIGIAESDQRKLFKEFVRIRNPETAAVPGSGLGLSTVRKLAMLYGGDATVESLPGKGSTFTVRLREAVPAPVPGAKV